MYNHAGPSLGDVEALVQDLDGRGHGIDDHFLLLVALVALAPMAPGVVARHHPQDGLAVFYAMGFGIEWNLEGVAAHKAPAQNPAGGKGFVQKHRFPPVLKQGHPDLAKAALFIFDMQGQRLPGPEGRRGQVETHLRHFAFHAFYEKHCQTGHDEQG
ncbi:MAG: hypothetical protein P8X55_11260 [Desulfosarcinaceae bacterium]